MTAAAMNALWEEDRSRAVRRGILFLHDMDSEQIGHALHFLESELKPEAVSYFLHQIKHEYGRWYRQYRKSKAPTEITSDVADEPQDPRAADAYYHLPGVLPTRDLHYDPNQLKPGERRPGEVGMEDDIIVTDEPQPPEISDYFTQRFDPYASRRPLLNDPNQKTATECAQSLPEEVADDDAPQPKNVAALHAHLFGGLEDGAVGDSGDRQPHKRQVYRVRRASNTPRGWLEEGLRVQREVSSLLRADPADRQPGAHGNLSRMVHALLKEMRFTPNAQRIEQIKTDIEGYLTRMENNPRGWQRDIIYLRVEFCIELGDFEQAHELLKSFDPNHVMRRDGIQLYQTIALHYPPAKSDFVQEVSKMVRDGHLDPYERTVLLSQTSIGSVAKTDQWRRGLASPNPDDRIQQRERD